jgi:tRNA1Val (adenine37-N6)-methyltransferase
MERHYSQPSFYHFSQDSIHLAKVAAMDFPERKDDLRVLDLCSGCGVVGIEFSFFWSRPIGLSFCEKNIKYQFYLKENLEKFLPDLSVDEYWFDFTEMLKIAKEKLSFDIILLNPPYYNFDSHRVSQNLDKRMAHFHQSDFWIKLDELLEHALCPENGRFYFCHPDQKIKWSNKYSWRKIEVASGVTIFCGQVLHLNRDQ